MIASTSPAWGISSLVSRGAATASDASLPRGPRHWPRRAWRRGRHTVMKWDTFAPSSQEPHQPREAPESSRGPGIAKAPSGALASEPPLGSVAPGSVERESVPLQSGRRVRVEGNAERGVILLVDDEELLLKTTRRMLEQRGFRVVTACNGAAAIELALKTPDIRVLLTDLSLPGMDGRELARRLRWALPELRVLFMSGFDAETSGLAAGLADAFLSKPFTARELEAQVKGLFGANDSDAAAQQG